jgi:hypothetical protein
LQWSESKLIEAITGLAFRISGYAAMADPLTIGLLATIFITKAFEKSGEKLGEGLTKKAGDAIAYLRRQSPKVAGALEAGDATVLDWGMATLEPIRAEPIFIELMAKAEAEAEENPVFQQKLQNIKSGKTVQVIISDLEASSLKAKSMKQTASSDAESVEQTMLKNVKVMGDIDLGDLTQEA